MVRARLEPVKLAVALVAQLVTLAALPARGANVAPDSCAAGLEPIRAIVEEEIQTGKIPGAVVVIGHRDDLVCRRAFGYRTLKPAKWRMSEDTVFDLASLTKVIATTTAVMQLADAGKLRLDDPVMRYWPAFGAHGKEQITVRQLLTHYSGLRPDLPPRPRWSGTSGALTRIVEQQPVALPDSHFIYSDLNFIVLGELVRRISGQPLDTYCAEHIFAPLGMRDTRFHVMPAQRDRIAPTTRWGAVHDPTAYRMGGVAGHAGLFSTAGDLARFAQMLLNGGRAGSGQVLSAAAIDLMTSSQSPTGVDVQHGLGWDIGSPFAASWRGVLSDRTYGHTGYTGTSLWVDPVSRTYAIILTNRVHPSGEGNVKPLRERIARLVAALAPVQAARALQVNVEAGVDVLASEGCAPLVGKRVGLITNHSGLDGKGRRTIDVLRANSGVEVVRLFSPEHGLTGNLDGGVGFTRDPTTQLPVFSLYGAVKRPTDTMLEGLDALVFDIQDAGARFFTYITTMGYAMEAAARKGIPFYVLDRPNPINAAVVQGPVLEEDLRSFTGYFPLPVRYGMTIGELAGLFNTENRVGAQLHVIGMRGYRRDAWYDETGLQWVGPSPNIRALDQAILYPGVALVEGANVSVGRGTEHPFEIVGAPWIDSQALASYLKRRGILGVRFEPVDFQPTQDLFQNRSCHGVRITVLDRQLLDVPELGVELASALHHMYPRTFRLDATVSMIGARSVIRAIEDGEDPRVIVRSWQPALATFRELRAKYLLY